MADPAKKTSPQNVKKMSFVKGSESHSEENTSQSSYSNSLIQTYEARISQLHGWLEAERQNYRELERRSREDKTRLEEKITELNEKLREDNTETKLSHKEEIHQLKEDHREEIDEKKEQIQKLERKIEIKELEERIGGKRGVGDRVMDMIENNGGDFLANLLTTVNQMAAAQQVQPNQLNPAQMNQAFTQAQTMSQQPQEEEHQESSQPKNGTPQDPSQEIDPNADRVSHENDSASEQTSTVSSSAANAKTRTNQQHTQEQAMNAALEGISADQLNPQQLMQAKQEIKQGILNAAINALTNQNSNLGEYAQFIRQQMQIQKQTGIQLGAKDWAQLAEAIASKAIEKEITPERVGQVIRPALDNVGKGKAMLKHLPPKAATNMLFDFFNIETKEPVKKLVTQVLAGFKQNL